MNDMYESIPGPENIDQPGQLETQPASVPYYYQPGQPAAAPSVPAFKAETKDGVFALVAFVLGYFFCRWVLTSAFGWGAAVFTVVFLGSVLLYLLNKGVRLPTESWVWFAVTLLTGLSFALWTDIGLIPLRNMFLFCAATYWVISAASVQIAGRTGNYLLLDGLNAVFVIPFRNFINQYRALGALKSGREKGSRKALSVLLGIVLALVVLLMVTPQLLKADSGGFSNLINSILNMLRFDWDIILEFLLYSFLAIPTAAYLFGLVSGSAVKRGVNAFTAEKAEKAAAAVKITPPVTVNIMLGAVCVLYVIFIACQLPYFFSAFTGNRPVGWLSYSEYARQGFFELTGIAVINLTLITAANIFNKTPRVKSTALKTFNIVLALVTLLLIATAFSKMALYIDTFGLTILRILPCVFMVLLAIVCIAVIVMQKLKFSVVRVTLIAGAVLFTALCLVDTDALVVRYNTERFLAATLDEYDTDILYRSGPAGVPYALEVYNTIPDCALKKHIWTYLKDQQLRAEEYAGTYRETLQSTQAGMLLEHLRWELE